MATALQSASGDFSLASNRTVRLLAPALAGALFAAALCTSAGMEGKIWVVAMAGIGVAAVLPIAAWVPGLAARSLLFLLAATLSISIKKHLMFVPGHLGGSIGLRISITEVLMFGLVVAAAAGLARVPRRLWTDRGLSIAFAVYFALATFSAVAASDLKLALFEWTALLQAYLVFLFLVNWLNSPARLRLFAAGLLVGLILQSAVTIIQAERPGMLTLSSLGAAEEQEDKTVNGRVALPDVDTGTTFVEGEVTHRPTGMLIHPNVLALYLVLTIPVAAAVWLAFPGWHFQWLSIAALGSGVAALYMTLSRSGWAGLAGGLAVAALLVWRWGCVKTGLVKRVLIGVAVCSLLVALGLRADRIYARWADTAGEAIDFRRDLAVMAWKMMARHPFLGVGLNSFVSVSGEYDATGMTRLKEYPVHNIFLLETSETGFPGGIAFLALVSVMMAKCLRATRSCRSSAAHALALFTTCGILGFWIGDAANFVYRVPIMTSLIWAHCALVLATGRVCGAERSA